MEIPASIMAFSSCETPSASQWWSPSASKRSSFAKNAIHNHARHRLSGVDSILGRLAEEAFRFLWCPWSQTIRAHHLHGLASHCFFHGSIAGAHLLCCLHILAGYQAPMLFATLHDDVTLQCSLHTCPSQSLTSKGVEELSHFLNGKTSKQKMPPAEKHEEWAPESSWVGTGHLRLVQLPPVWGHLWPDLPSSGLTPPYSGDGCAPSVQQENPGLSPCWRLLVSGRLLLQDAPHHVCLCEGHRICNQPRIIGLLLLSVDGLNSILKASSRGRRNQQSIDCASRLQGRKGCRQVQIKSRLRN